MLPSKLEESVRRTMQSVLILTTLLILTLAGARASQAQQSGTQEQNEHATPETGVYRVSYRVNEMEDGKTINSRSYTIMAKAGNRESAHIGSKIPVAFQGKLDYHDVGMAFSCVVHPQQGSVGVHSEFNMNTVANGESASSPMSPPVMRQFFLADDTLATLGKPAFVASIDDVASNRHYVIEVTVTKAD